MQATMQNYETGKKYVEYFKKKDRKAYAFVKATELSRHFDIDNHDPKVKLVIPQVRKEIEAMQSCLHEVKHAAKLKSGLDITVESDDRSGFEGNELSFEEVRSLSTGSMNKQIKPVDLVDNSVTIKPQKKIKLANALSLRMNSGISSTAKFKDRNGLIGDVLPFKDIRSLTSGSNRNKNTTLNLQNHSVRHIIMINVK
jgi:hypothetical protein